MAERSGWRILVGRQCNSARNVWSKYSAPEVLPTEIIAIRNHGLWLPASASVGARASPAVTSEGDAVAGEADSTPEPLGGSSCETRRVLRLASSASAVAVFDICATEFSPPLRREAHIYCV
eukprot:scaffold319629_cov36-Tisochrysis_lutea.AAC.4